MKYVALIVLITAMVLAWTWFGWKLALVIFLGLFGNNLEQKSTGE